MGHITYVRGVGESCCCYNMLFLQKFHSLSIFFSPAIILYAKNFGFEDNKKTIPLYAAFCI